MCIKILKIDTNLMYFDSKQLLRGAVKTKAQFDNFQKSALKGEMHKEKKSKEDFKLNLS